MEALALSLGLKTITEAVCAYCEITYDELISRKRHPAYVLARRLIVVMAREHTRQGYPTIQRHISEIRGHSASIERYQTWPAVLKANKPVRLSAERTVTPQEAIDRLQRWANDVKAQAQRKAV